MKVKEKHVSGFLKSWEKYHMPAYGPIDSFQGFSGSARQITIVVAFARQISIVFS